MRLRLVILASLMALLGACAAKHLPPAPVAGIDIAIVHEGQQVPFNGTLMSDFYLNEYLQWKTQ